jgi:hypothetical protein
LNSPHNGIQYNRREGNNWKVIGQDNNPTDHDHVGKQTPLQSKQKGLQDDPRYRTELVPDINKELKGPQL